MARRKNTKRIDPRYFLNEKTDIKEVIREEIEAAIDEGFIDSLKGAAGAVGAKATDAIKGTGNLNQTAQARKQITALVQKLAKDGYGGPDGARSLAQHLQGLANQILENNPDDAY